MISVHQFASEYEFRGDGGDHVPTDGERAMIEDAIGGYLAARQDPVVEALGLAVKHLNDLEEFCGPNRPCCDPGAECPISMGEWFTRQDKEELATIRAALPHS